jgi:excisionase family DNA binding protein
MVPGSIGPPTSVQKTRLCSCQRSPADYLQVHPETVRRWLREGSLIGVSLGGRTRWRVRREDLETFISSAPRVHEDEKRGS